MRITSFFITAASLALAACSSGSDAAQKPEAPAAESVQTDTLRTDSLGFRWVDVRKEFNENPFNFFDGDGLLLAAGSRQGMNAMTIGWGQLGTLWGMQRPVVNVYVRKSRYTDQFMAQNDYFTVSGFSKDFSDALRYMGTHSGRDGDKVAASGLHTVFTQKGNPYFREARIVLECKKLYQAPLQTSGMGQVAKECYEKDTSVHNLYIGEIVNAWVK